MKTLSEIIKTAEILVVAIRKAEFIKDNWISLGVVVIDIGTNTIKVVSYIIPVLGSVGPMTVAILLQNTVESAKSDIDITTSQTSKHIKVLTEELELISNKFDLYGQYKAKDICLEIASYLTL
ncbi:35146_t:CDS:2 [Racocetra persica]|uniref:35146_t:CDS:1 n=1 Tax=Racocetra persica TaxID=160502 RepID=A0ACA9Q260_9GLOM|nr:35146_t:CDS:2 [Racocetra persica]